jgi:hypothetical protein
MIVTINKCIREENNQIKKELHQRINIFWNTQLNRNTYFYFNLGHYYLILVYQLNEDSLRRLLSH